MNYRYKLRIDDRASRLEKLASVKMDSVKRAFYLDKLFISVYHFTVPTILDNVDVALFLFLHPVLFIFKHFVFKILAI
jgi:hypothetical protein